MIQLKSNEYWGKKTGKVANVKSKWDSTVRVEYQFKIKKWGNGSNNAGPTGRKQKKAKRGKIK